MASGMMDAAIHDNHVTLLRRSMMSNNARRIERIDRLVQHQHERVVQKGTR